MTERKKNINNELFNYYFGYLKPTIMFERLKNVNDDKNKDMVKSINQKLTKLMNMPEDRVSKVEENN